MASASFSLANLSSTIKGTAQFWAPELLVETKTQHSKETDIWAFGITGYVRVMSHDII